METRKRYIVAFSGGKDSIAMVLHLLYALNIPKEQIELHHHEVDGRGKNLFDWQCTTSYCIAFAKAFDLPLYFSYRKGGIAREILRFEETSEDVYIQKTVNGKMICIPSIQKEKFFRTRHKFPAISADLKTRWCSGNVKISILNKVITHQTKYNEFHNIVCTGERRAESVARSKYKERELHTTNSQKRVVEHWRPIIDFSDAEVWALLEKYKVQPHPSYMLGWGRCSCQLCIFGSPNIWATLLYIDAPKIHALAALEKEINHTLFHKKVKGEIVLIPITEIAAKGKPFEVVTTDNEYSRYWIKQALGTFTAPIIVNEWNIPIGASSKEKSGSI